MMILLSLDNIDMYGHSNFDWNQAENQSYLDWYLHLYDKQANQPLTPIIQKLRQMIRLHQNQSKALLNTSI